MDTRPLAGRLGTSAIVRLVAAVFLACAVAAGLWATRASAQTPISLRVTTGPSPTATDVVDVAGQTYAAAKAALRAREAASPATATFKVGFTGLTDLTSTNAELRTDDASFSVALQGSTTVLGAPGRLLVTATWANVTDTQPHVSVLTRFDTVGLSTLNSQWTSTPVTFTPAFVGVTDADHAVAPSAVLGTDTFLNDGLPATDDTFALKAAGLNFQGVVGSGPLVDGARELGSGGTAVRLRGTLATSLTVLGGAANGAGLDLAVDIPVTTPTSFPSWVKLTSPWTLALHADTSKNFSASFSGGATVAADGANTVPVTGTASVDVAGGATTLGLDLNIGAINDLFGQTWLDLGASRVTAKLTQTSFEGSISGGLTVGSLSGEATLTLNVAQSGDVAASLDVATTSPISSASLLSALGATPAGIDPGLVDLTLNAAKFHVSVNAPKGGTKTVTASVFADTSLTIGQGAFNAQMLFRITGSTGSHEVLVAGRLTTPTLKQLDPEIPFDWKLPDLEIVASTSDVATPYADLDTPTQAFFASVLCDAQGAHCTDLDAKKGLQIKALVTLDPNLVSQLKTLGIEVTGPVELAGTLPIFGGSNVSLHVGLPVIKGPADGLVKQGNVSFDLAFDTASKTVKASINGNMVFRITRSGQCVGVPSGTWPNGSGCYDELALTVSAGVSVGTGGVEISLAAQIDEWNHAFGLDWLKINTLRLQLGLKAGGGNPVELNIGFLGRMQFGTGAQTKDLTLAIKVGITPTPPWIDLQGFTLASADGIGLREVAQAFDRRYDTSKLPDLSLKNLWFAYGEQNDDALCIRQGLFISAELHIGAPTSSNATPGCIPQQTLPATPDELPTASCESSNTCIAAVLVDVQTGSSPSFTGAGLIKQFDLGPLHFDTTRIALVLSETNQRFAFTGAATLHDPSNPAITWLGANVNVDAVNNGGATSLVLDAGFNIGGDQGLTFQVSGKVAADFSQLGTKNFEAFVQSLQYDLTVEASLPALQNIDTKVATAFQPVKDYVATIGPEVQKAFDQPTLDPNLKRFLEAFGSLPPQPVPDPYLSQLSSLDISLTNRAQLLQQYVAEAQAQVVASESIFGHPDWVLDRTNQSIAAIGGLRNVLLHGGHLVLYSNLITLERDFQGACGLNVDGPLCEGTETPALLTKVIIEPVVGSQYKVQTGFILPSAAAPAVKAAAVAAPTDSLTAVTQLNTAFTGEGTNVECMTTTAHYGPGGVSQDPVVANVTAYGQRTVVSQSIDLNDASSIGRATTGGAIDNVLGLTRPGAPCRAPRTVLNAGGTTLVTSAGSVNEGGSITVSGTTDPALRGKAVAIVWGDGGTSSVTASAADGSWSASHQYLDDAGPGTSTSYLVNAQVAGVPTSITARVSVVNLAPILSNLNITRGVFEGQTASVTGRVFDTGTLDGHTIHIDWSDGQPTTINLPPGVLLSFTATHTYRDDNPSRTPADTVLVTVDLTDKDGGRATELLTTLVTNVSPTDLTLGSATIGTTPVTRDSTGTLVIPEGSDVVFNGSLRDPGVDDQVSMGASFEGASSADILRVVPDTADPTLRHATLDHHRFVDNGPANRAGLVNVSLFASDDDGGNSNANAQVRVIDVAPTVAVPGVAPTTENVVASLTTSFTDPGVNDTHTAIINWGDKTAPQTVAVSELGGKGTLSATHTYGDNGTYTITVSVTDNDGIAGTSTATVRVDNTKPVVVIDKSAAKTFNSVPIMLGVQAQAVSFTGTVTDPGSDDLTSTWTFGDGKTTVLTSQVNPPNADPAQSATIQPRVVQVPTTHAYAQACTYRTSLSSVDDDGGAATPDGIDVVILAAKHKWEGTGFWKNAYQGKGSITSADLGCYLKIVSTLSKVLGSPDPVALATSTDALAVLNKSGGGVAEFDRALLMTWLNVANGSVSLTTPFDFNRDGKQKLTVAEVLANAEAVRLNPASTKDQLDKARDQLDRVERFATN